MLPRDSQPENDANMQKEAEGELIGRVEDTSNGIGVPDITHPKHW